MIDPYETAWTWTATPNDQAIRNGLSQGGEDGPSGLRAAMPSSSRRLQAVYDLLKDPVRRKVYDDTGYDPQLADPRDLKGLLMLETLVNEFILDEREPGSFDPVAAMRRKLSDDIVKSRFHILELERHRARVRQHLDRLGRRPETDVLGSMLRARSRSIAEAIKNTEEQIKTIEQAYEMLEGYSYELEALEVKAHAAE